MGRVIPNENSYIAFSATPPVSQVAPTPTEVANATNLTHLTASITASSQGNAIPTPDLSSLFETTVPGTSQAQFSADFYRDDASDDAWDALARNTTGVFYISRFGGTGTDYLPIDGDALEVWPVHVISRTAGPLSSNTPQTFTVTCAVNVEPSEDAVVTT